VKTGGLAHAMSCGEKRAYGTWAGANKVARRMRRNTHEKVRAYACKHGCGMYHVGHSDKELKRAAQRKRRKPHKV
jgi:hypothetical protein